MSKIVQRVKRCRECPSRRYGSGGRYDCTKADDAPLLDIDVLPAWCPLPDDPAPIAARALLALDNAKAVVTAAKGEAKTATPDRLRELIAIISEQLDNGS